jgi:predicted metal-dependent HD superfamily phosphohydrolase
MIRHIVSWKLSAQDAEGKSAAFTEIAEALGALPALIPEIQTLRVAHNQAYLETNWDVVLVADYNTFDDLEAYRVHPEHVKTAAIVRSHTTDRAAVDFEL